MIRSLLLVSMEEKKITKPTKKKFKNPDCYKTFASKRGVSANNHTASAASRLVLFLLFYAHAFVLCAFLFPCRSLHTASTALLFLDHTHNSGSLLWNGLRPVTAKKFTV